MSILHAVPTDRYARTIAASRRVRWEIERDVIRGRDFDFTRHFLPTGLSLVNELEFLSPTDKRLLSQVQGRTYANLVGLVERYIGAKTTQLCAAHTLGDQVALEALVRMTDEEIKHQELFRRLDAMMGRYMPPGYALVADANAVARNVLSRRTWSVLALTLDFELFTQAHWRACIEPQSNISDLWKDVFLFHWKEESQHAVLDELELLRENERLDDDERSAAVDDLIALFLSVDAVLRAQAEADARYFCAHARAPFDAAGRKAVGQGVLKAYRWQYIVSGAMEPRFQQVLFSMLNPHQAARLHNALAPLTYAVPRQPEMPLPMAA